LKLDVNLRWGFNVPACLTTIIRFNFTGLILSRRRSEFPNVRSGFTLDPCCYRLLGLAMLGISRGLRNYRRKVLISDWDYRRKAKGRNETWT
jgi:hypothetical protein